MKLLTPAAILDHFGLNHFTCLDFETTGLDAAICDIIEVGAVKVINGEISDSFHSLISIDADLPEAITHLTGIKKQDLLKQPRIETKIPGLLQFLGETPLVAHNLSFDLGFLLATLTRMEEFTAANRLQMDSLNQWDILLLARILFPLLQSHRLEALMETFHIQNDTQHRALDDALTEVQIFDRVLLKSLELPNETLAQLVTLTRGKKSNIARFIQNLHKLRSQKYQLLTRNTLPSFPFDYPVSVGILYKDRNSNGEQRPFDAEEVEEIFRTGGCLAGSLTTYEQRSEQIEMVKEVCRAYEYEEFLMVEAGTGTGKSWAYLVPAILWSQSQVPPMNRTIVSTNTKNLQDQIFYKDLPFLKQHIPVDFQAVLLKGRNNYLCLNRWNKFLSQIDFATDNSHIEEILPLVVWMNETRTGDIEETNWNNPSRSGRIWWQIRSDGHYCRGQACQFKDRCFVNHVRRAARDADVVVVNHSLLLSDLISDNKILADYQNLVLDEAHNLENAATQFLGVNWSFWSLYQLILPLKTTGGESRNELDILTNLLKRQKWTEEEEKRKTILNNIDQTQLLTADLQKSNENFFHRLQQALPLQLVKNHSYSQKIRYKNWQKEYANFVDTALELMTSLTNLQGELLRLSKNLAEILEQQIAENDREVFENSCAFVQGTVEALSEWGLAIKHLLLENNEQNVYWMEVQKRKDTFEVQFYAAPLHVARLLKNKLYDRLRTAVFTSATLSVDQKFTFFENRLGIDLVEYERRNSRIVGSPFDFEGQILVLIPQYMPNPNYRQFTKMSADLIQQTLIKTRRSSLILFTSYRMLNEIYELAGANLRAHNLVLLAQGKSGTRNNLLRMLREGKAQALLGTHSFWEGIDLPGEALEILIITKLPFEVPSEPVVQARIEQIEKMGGNSFYDYSVPNAVLRFRQGFGRLIRSKSDRGVIMLLDSRIVSSRYGSIFLNSMPVQAEILPNPDRLINQLKQWFSIDD